MIKGFFTNKTVRQRRVVVMMDLSSKVSSSRISTTFISRTISRPTKTLFSRMPMPSGLTTAITGTNWDCTGMVRLIGQEHRARVLHRTFSTQHSISSSTCQMCNSASLLYARQTVLLNRRCAELFLEVEVVLL